MTQIEILKDLCRSLDSIYDAAADWSDERQELYDSSITALHDICDDVIFRDNVSQLNSFVEVVNEISEIPDVSKIFNKKTLKFVLALIKRIKQLVSDGDWGEDIADADEYKIVQYKDDSPYVNICYSNPSDPNNIMCIMRCDKIDKLEEDLANYCNSSQLLLRIIHCIDLKKNYGRILLLPKSAHQKKIHSRIEYIKLAAVLEGREFNIPQDYTYSPSSAGLRYTDDIEYTQYSEIIDVMNEYNIQENVLDKFLRAYQAIENYMYRIQICNVCKMKNYSKIGVREFKHLSEKLETKETTALDELLKKVGDFIIDGTSIKQTILNKWMAEQNSDPQNMAKIQSMLDFLYINETASGVSIGNVMKIWGNMVYKARCSIVHNKVNENHLSYINLNEDNKWVIEHILLPNMEFLVYGLMINDNEYISYQQKAISLY